MLRYGAFVLAVLAGVTAVVHWRWVRAVTPEQFIPDRQPLPCCDAHMLARLGRLDPPRAGSFQVLPLEKRPAALRIGCFGDSFTAGHEVVDALDFPQQLERALHAHGATHVEVVNFGNTGFGFHQMHLMAELVAPHFAIDRAVFVPMLEYWVFRDGTFALWPPPTKTLSIHGRYILDGEDVRLIDPVGTTEAEQFHAYTRLVPPVRYLRYDRRPPAFLQAWLPLHRTLPNPFYYGPTDEVREGYRRLLRRQLAGPPSVLLDPMGGVAELLDQPPDARRGLLRLHVPQRFPYLAPQNHWSSWGNRLVAEYALRAFDVSASTVVDLVETSADPPAAEVPSDRTIAAHDDMKVLLADRPVGGMYRYETGSWETPRVSRLPAETVALVALVAPGRPLADALFVPLAAPPVAGQVTAEAAGTGTRLPLEMRLHWVADGVARLDLCDGRGLGALTTEKIAARCIVPVPWDTQGPGRPIMIRVGETELATIDPGVFGVFVRPRGVYFKLRADGDLPAEPASLPERGEIALVLLAKGTAAAHVPLGRFHRTTRRVAPDFAPLTIR